MNKIINLFHKKQTDERTYQILKKNKDETFMDAEKWKKKRLIQLKKEGILWNK